MAQPPSPTSPTRRNFWSAYAQRAEDYTTHDLPNFSFGSPGTSASGGSSRSLSVSDGYGGESEGSGEIEEEGESHERVPRGRSMKIDTTPRPSVAVAGRSHQSQVIHSTPTKHPSSLHSSSRSPPINELNALNRIDSGSGDHHHPEEINDTTLSDNADYHPNVFHDQEHDYNESDYYSSGDEEYIIYSDDGSEPDIEVSSARYDPDGSVEGPAINPRLIPSIHSSGSRSTSIRRKGSSATESYWSGKSGYGSVTGRKGSVVSDWSYGAGSGIEGRQQDYYSSEELALPPSEHTSVSGDSHIPSSGEDWRRLLGPVQVTNIGALGSPDSPHFAVPSELNDDASVSASSRADAASDFDIPYITQFDQPPDFVSIASGATGSTSISSPAFSSVSILSLPSSSGIQSFSGSSISGSVAAASGSLYTHHYSQSRSTMDSFGSGDRPMPLPPFLQQHLYQQGKKSLPGAYQTPWELMNKTPFSKSPLNAGNKGKARERPPSMMSALSANSLASSFNFPHDDTFARSLNTWGGQNYRDLRKAWVFRRERSGSHHGSSTSSSGSMRTNRTGRREVQLGMTVPSQERWNNFLLGRFVVIREEVGREGVVGASPPKSLSKPSPDSQKSGSKKGLDKESLNTESSARAREKGKAKEESWGDGQSEQKPVTDPSRLEVS
ncbi:hypothetical protein L218DRAFT_623979 [Marasmius fiardii PR-910]|nr:hypothetical protein L218DRAFT_623979 [Marasmius fiardii PR-910]